MRMSTSPSRSGRRLSFRLATAGGLAALAFAAASPALATDGTLPGGTSIAVAVSSPVDGSVIPYGDPIAFSGTASVGAANATPQTAIVYDLDVSGSTQASLGATAVTNCDNPNGDALSGTTLDCEITSLLDLNQSAIGKGSVADVGVVALGGAVSAATGVGDSVQGDVQPTAGSQALTSPSADLDGTGGADVTQVLRSAHVPGGGDSSAPGLSLFTSVHATGPDTNYEDSVIVASATAGSSTAPTKIVVLVSDGAANRGNTGLPGSNGLGQFATPAAFRTWVAGVAGSVKFITFAVGSLASCSPAWNGYGTLADIATATGGTCTLVLDPATLPDVVPGLVSSVLTGVTGTLDAVDVPLTVTPPPPQDGPASSTWASTSAIPQQAPGSHTFCATAAGTDGGGAGTVNACSTVTVVAADPGGPYGGDSNASFEGTAIPVSAQMYGGATFDGWSWAPKVGVDAGATCAFADASQPTTTVTCTDDGTFTLTAHTTGPSDARGADLVLFNRPPALQTPTLSPTGTVLPGTSVTVSGAFSDAGINDTHTCTVAWSDGVTDAGVVTEAAGAGTCADTRSLSTTGTYTATVTVLDDDGGSASASTSDGAGGTITVSNVQIDPGTGPGGAYTGVEGDAIHPTATIPSGATIAWSASPVTADAGASCSGTGLTTATPSITCTDDGTFRIDVSVTLGSITQSASIPLILTNAAPVVAKPVLSAALVATGTPVTATAAFTDAGTNDTHTCTIAWDDGLVPVAGTVTETPGSGAGTCARTDSFATPGIYRVTATVTDDDSGVGSASYEYLVVYDASAGFVTGGGTINVAAGSYVAGPTLSGKGTFGFESKYQKGATTPTGNTEFHFHAASFDFSSTAYQWLVVSGAKAQYKGTGTVNGVGGYGFLVTVTDGQLSGGGGTDKFRIKIWDITSGTTVFDNVLGASTDISSADPQAVASGSIVIHAK